MFRLLAAHALMPYVSERMPAVHRDTDIQLWRPPAIEAAPAVKDYHRYERHEHLAMTPWQPIVSVAPRVAPPVSRYSVRPMETVEPVSRLYSDTHVDYFTVVDYQEEAYAPAHVGKDQF